MDTGWLTPSSTGTPNNNWINPSNAYLEDGSFATVGNGENYQDYRGFNANIPTDALIKGIEFKVEAKISAAPSDFVIWVINDRVDGGDFRGDASLTTSLAWYTFGGPTSLGGFTTDWTPSDFNNDSAHIQVASFTSGGQTTSIDNIQLKIYWGYPNNYGVKIAKEGYDVKEVLTSANKKNFTILSTDSAHKVSAQGVVSGDVVLGHGLGFVPFIDSFILKSSLTQAHPSDFNSEWQVSCDDTIVYMDERYGTTSLFTIIYLNQP